MSTNTTTPAVSVMMIVHNAERYLSAAIESILQQTHRDFELVAVDDGSTDRSAAIIERFAERDKRIRWTSRPNKGISPTRNESLGMARGAYVAVMDADDIAHPDRLERQVAFLDEHPEVVCVGGWFEVIDDAGRYLTCLKPPADDAGIQQLLLQGSVSICQPTAMFRRQAALDVGGFDETIGSAEDLDLFLKLGEIGVLANIAQPLVQYRLHSTSTTSRHREAAHANAQAVCERAWRRRGLEGQEFRASHARPDHTGASRLAFLVKCGWWAFNSRQRFTAFVYGLKAVKVMPYRLDGWKLVACSLMKSWRQSDAAR